MPISKKINVLKRCSLFVGCTDSEISQIFAKATVLSMKAGDPVFVINDPSRFVYVVVSGSVDIIGQAISAINMTKFEQCKLMNTLASFRFLLWI